MTYVVAVTGGREYSDRGHVWRVLDEIHARRSIALIVTGYCSFYDRAKQRFVPTGADRWAIEWAEYHGVPHTGEKYRANWYPDGKTLDRGAGPKRNARMLHNENVDRLAAFPGGNGTNSCVEIARRMGIAVRDERHG